MENDWRKYGFCIGMYVCDFLMIDMFCSMIIMFFIDSRKYLILERNIVYLKMILIYRNVDIYGLYLFLVLSYSGGFFSFSCCYDNGMDFRGEV